MSEELQPGKALQALLELAQAWIGVEPVGAADAVGGVEGNGHAQSFGMGEEVEDERVVEGEVGHELADSLAALRLVVAQPEVQRRVR